MEYNINNMEGIFVDIYKNDKWNMGQNESKSGLGSTSDFTQNIKNTLISFIDKKSIHSLLDTSCGDWAWMKTIQNSLPNYTGLDIVKDIVDKNTQLYSNNNIKFVHSDFLTYIKNQNDKSIDLILCRHTLEHLPTEYNLDFLNECKRVCKYLFVTGYNNIDIKNTHLSDSIYRPINLKHPPYSNILNSFYESEFYDGPTDGSAREMVMNIYNFTPLQI
jgi:ubiquinone/menaquinone biosynthesis C-methylase UbiE